jgi:pSer/pThr/pTyr-binding forkhead associated (FHA) protein
MAAFFDIGMNCPKLEAIAGPLTGQSFPVSDELLIGAVDGNDLVISGDATLSGFHARVLLADKALTIEDSNSTNGTFVNGVRLGEDRKLLKPGDEIRMGKSVFTVRAG